MTSLGFYSVRLRMGSFDVKREVKATQDASGVSKIDQRTGSETSTVLVRPPESSRSAITLLIVAADAEARGLRRGGEGGGLRSPVARHEGS